MLIDPQSFAPENDDVRRQPLPSDDVRRPPPPSGNGKPPSKQDTRVRPLENRSLPLLVDAFVKASSLNNLIEMIPSRISTFIGCRRVLLYEVRDEKLHMVSSTVDATSRWTTTLLRLASVDPIPLTDNTPETRALQGERAVIEPGKQGVPTRIIAPMHSLGGPVGVLVVIPAEDEDSWGGDGLRASQTLLIGLEDAAHIAAMALESAKLLTENHQRAEEMDLLTRLTNAFNNSVLDLDAAIGIVERQVSRITRVDLCAVALGTSAARSPILPGRWLRNEIIKSIQALTMYDDVSVWPLAHLLPDGVRSFYAFPLLADERVVGVLALAFRAPHVMEYGERNLLSILANTASTVLQKARLHADAERARQHARDMLERAQNEERFKDAILRNIQSGLLTIDLEGRVTSLNAQAAEVLDLGDKPMKGRPVEDIMVMVDPGPHVVRAGLGQRFAPQRREVRVRTATGHDLMLAVTVAALRLTDGKDIGALCAFQDLTHMRAVESEMQRMAQAATLGFEATSISHDINNVITAILWGIQKMEPMVSGNTDARLDINLMVKDISRITAMAENMLHLTQSGTIHPKLFEVNDLLERILRLNSPRVILARVTIERYFEPGATLLADEHQIARVLDNICINALEAMAQEGGTLKVRTRTTRSPVPVEPAKTLVALDNRWQVPIDPRLQLQGYGTNTHNETALLLSDGRQKAIEIEISDTGKGIPPEHMQEIWEVGKSFDKGSTGHGFGLATVKKIIDAHGGTCTVTSKVGQGTTFTLRLPSGK